MAAAPPLGFEVVSSAMSGEVEPVKQALLTKYDINARDASSRGTVLHAIASALALDSNTKDGHIELIRWLLEHGIDYSIKDEAGKTAEERLAEAKQHHEAAKALEMIRKWKAQNTLADQEARRQNLRRDQKKEKHDLEEAERLFRMAKSVRVGVLSAKELRTADSNGKSDPYVKLRYGAPKRKEMKVLAKGKPNAEVAVESHHDHHKYHRQFARQKKHTKTIPKTLSPTWNESFEFETNQHKEKAAKLVHPADEDHLRLEVWDKDDVRDDFLGYVQLSLHDICEVVARGEKEHRLVLLPDRVGSIALHFEVH